MIPKLMPFDYYLRNKDVVNRSADPGAARSMIEKAEKRYRFITTLTIDEDNATFIFEEIYTVIRECAQCLMMADGYNSKYSHEAPIAFISEKYREFGDQLAAEFDRYRKKRNDSIYRDTYASLRETTEALKVAEEYIRITRLIFDSKYLK
ncbi:hypothetical protein [Methanocella sp. MCL-LM]|uniref:hypothetical protein n=1 Tax=Methanocella sp. MCL-LM TaxID=3412035 RepID=UPI003C74007E